MEHYCQRIRENLVYLTENTTNVYKLLLYLLQENIIQKPQHDEITSERVPQIQTRMIYTHLMEKGSWAKGPQVYQKFREVLITTGNEHIADTLDKWKPKNDKSLTTVNTLQEIAKSLRDLHPLEIKQLNTMLAKDGNNNISLLTCSNAGTKEIEDGSNILNKQDRCCQTEMSEATIQTNKEETKPEKASHYVHNSFLLNDVTLTENPLACPTLIGQLVMYHVKMEGSTFRKFLKYIRGLHTFKYFSFSRDGEFALLDLDLLHDSHLVDVTFKNINLSFDGREIQTLKTVTRLQLWMCTMEEDFFQTLSTYFPMLEYIEICGCIFGKEAGVKAVDFEAMLSISHLKEIFIQPWTNAAFNGDVSAIMEIIEAPTNPWSVFIQRDQSYTWKYVGRERKKKL